MKTTQESFFENKPKEGESELTNKLYAELEAESQKDPDSIDPAKIEAIIALLDVMEPLPNDPSDNMSTEQAFERFQKKYNVTLKQRKRQTRQKFLPKVAVIFLALICINVTVDAAYDKSILQLANELGSYFIMDFGHKVPSESIENEAYSSWDELAAAKPELKLMVPGYIPNNFNLKTITISNSNANWQISGNYDYNEPESERYLIINIYGSEYDNTALLAQDTLQWVPAEKDVNGDQNVQYYTFVTDKEELCKAIFYVDEISYTFEGDMKIDEMKKIIENMEDY